MKKKLIIAAAAVGALAAAVPAMAVENEFHGMYKFMGYQSNFIDGTGTPNLVKDAHAGFVAEQRARIAYTAKANDNLKLVTHFELDTRFGGIATTATTGYKGTTGNDSGNLDADQLTLETKNIYLDFNCPLTGANVKVGMQPWADSYNSIFLLADMTGLYATKKIGDVTASLGWFRFDDNTNSTSDVGQNTADLIVLDGKFMLNKDMKVGASYYNVQDDAAATGYELLHVLGLNADLTFGPANVKPFFLYEFGEASSTVDINAMALGATAKVKVANGAVNLSALYLSGDKDTTDKKAKDFKPVTNGTTYFNPANMWILIRSGQAINSSVSALGNDLSVGDRGSMGLFAGYEGTAGKISYNANIGYMAANEKQSTTDKTGVGTEINLQVGYKMFDNMTASAAAAYAMLGDRFDASKADDPYLFNVQLSYTF